jgi:23S rRNA (cytosine1962-C5)-methyltransferase
VLDAFCNQGSFGLQAALGGAASVEGIDQSTEAIGAAKANAERNGHTADFRVGNVFDAFNDETSAGVFYDLIVLDPPPFARNRRAVDGALRGYRELHLRSLQRLSPGGILCSYCCSQHVSREAFLSTLADAALDAGRDVRLLAHTSQPADHPVRLDIPQTEYLKGVVVEVTDGA